MSDPKSSTNKARTPSRFEYQSIISASPEKVKADLISRLEKIPLKESGTPHLKQHLKRVKSAVNSMPEIWNQAPLEAQSSLRKHASELSAEEKEALEKIDTAIAEVNQRREENGKSVQITVPTLISWLNNGANHPDKADFDFNERFEAFVHTIERRTLSPAQKKERRLSLPVMLHPLPESEVGPLPSDSKRAPLRALSQPCTKNNPQFAVFAHYKWKAIMAGEKHEAFDSVFETRVLSGLPNLKGLAIEAVRDEVRNLIKPKGPQSLRFQTLLTDPYGMLDKNWAEHWINADALQLMPVLLKIVIRAALETEKRGTKIPLPEGKEFNIPVEAGVPYLETKHFAEDYRQLQIALTQGAAKTSSLVSKEELNKTLGSARSKKRKDLDKEKDDNEERDTASPYKTKPKKENVTTTNTTSATTTTTTTTISTTGVQGKPSKAVSQKGHAKLVSGSSIRSMHAEIKPAYEATLKLASQLDEEFGFDLVLALFKVFGSLNEVLSNRSKPERKQSPMQLALPADLSGIEQDALKDVGDDLKHDVRKLGSSEEARLLVEFIVEAANVLKALPPKEKH